ncbi:MAG: hypothetical protein V4696_03000 [Pseudomonadota bacterium]
MAFSDYQLTPDANTVIGGSIFIGPNMARGDVREALQQFAADGRALSDVVVDASLATATPPENYFTTRAAGAAATATDALFSSDEEGAMAVYRRTAIVPNYLKLYEVATKAYIDGAIAAFSTTIAGKVAAATLADVGGAALVGVSSGGTLQAMLDTLGGRLSPVSANVARSKIWTAPTGLNNPLGLSVVSSGGAFAFNRSPYEAADWAKYATGISHFYVDWALGADVNAGTSAGAGNAWKTFDKVLASAVDKSIIHLMDARVGANWYFTGDADFGARRIKIISGHSSGETVVCSTNENWDTTYMAWVADGSAFKSTAATTGSVIYSMGDLNYRDAYGLPLAMPHVASLAVCKTTPGSWNWDGTTLSVHMIDARTPDIANGWMPISSYSGGNFKSDADLTMEGLLFAYNGGGAGLSALRIRPTTTGAANTQKVALKNVKGFGSDANAIQVLDKLVVAAENCFGGNCFYDILNYSTFISTGTKAQWMTVYESNCGGHDAGYSGRANPTASDSNNLTTAHAGMHVWRVNPKGYNIPNSWLGDVGGVYSITFGARASEATAGTLFQNGFWYQRLSGEGSANAKMVLIGCDADATSAGKYHLSNWNDAETAASLGEIHIADWLGVTAPSVRAGTILKNYETGAVL